MKFSLLHAVDENASRIATSLRRDSNHRIETARIDRIESVLRANLRLVMLNHEQIISVTAYHVRALRYV